VQPRSLAVLPVLVAAQPTVVGLRSRPRMTSLSFTAKLNGFSEVTTLVTCSCYLFLLPVLVTCSCSDGKMKFKKVYSQRLHKTDVHSCDFVYRRFCLFFSKIHFLLVISKQISIKIKVVKILAPKVPIVNPIPCQ